MTTEINIAELVNSHVTVDAGVATIHQDGIDAALLASDIDQVEYRRLQKASAKVAAGIVDVIGEKSIDAMAADKNLHRVASTFKIGHEEYNIGVARNGTVNVPSKNGEKVKKEVIGLTTVRRKTKVGGSGFGEAKKRISALGIKKLGA